MVIESAEKIAQRAFDLGLLDERQIRDAWATLGSRGVPVEDFVQLLLRRNWMTSYQVDRLKRGERSGFFFGDYKVLYLVGMGSFARVYRAVHRQTGKVVAVKVLRSRFSENPAQYNLFVREGQMGCTLRHPNIVPIYEVCSRKHIHFLVMEFVEGWNLSEFVRIRQKLEPLEATRLMMDICQGMSYAFERGIIHRDLKLNNVLVSSRKQAKIVDFGLAGMEDEETDDLPGDLANTRTIDYAALERATGVRKDDQRSDIYFLGCIFYHMLTGMPPLTATRDRLQRLSKTRFLEIKPIREVDPSLPDSVVLAVNKSMMFDPRYRYQTPAAMLADLRLAMKRISGATKTGQEGSGILAHTEPTHTVMVVEANPQMQDIFRQGLKRAGYRVLLTADLDRAWNRFQQESSRPDCLIVSTERLGEPAVGLFNRFAEDVQTQQIPAVLLLGDGQEQWIRDAKTADHRIVLQLPLTMKQFCAALGRLLQAKPLQPQ